MNEKKLLFVVFSGSDWCGWCKRYADGLLVKPEFQRKIKDRYVLVYIDKPSDKSLLSAKCLEQNGMVADMLGAGGGVPETIIATAGGIKLLSLGGCRHIERGADSWFEFFNPIDDALKVVEIAYRNAEKEGLGTEKADEILLDVFRQLDEDVAIEHFSAEIAALIERRKNISGHFPFFEYVKPISDEYASFYRAMNREAQKQASDGMRFDRQKMLAANKKYFAENDGFGKVQKWLAEIQRVEGKLSEKGIKHLRKLQMKIIGLRNICR